MRTQYDAEWVLSPGDGADNVSMLLPYVGFCQVRSGSKVADNTGGALLATSHRPITGQEIAEASEASVRSLGEGFRRFKGTSPMAYLRRIRLDAIRADISTPGGTLPIAEVALKWGFPHPGRFSAFYREVFGELPSETAARTLH